jgi:hypothetical protein
MAIPSRPTVESQVQPGHAPIPAYETPLYRVGRKGLNLVDAIDDLQPEELSRSLNMRSLYGGMLEVRPGQTALATTTGTDRVHSIVRLNDPAASSFTLLAGSNTNVYRGQSGALTLIDSNYSGDPLTFQAANLPRSGTPFVFIGDRSRNRKVDRTNAVSVIGLPPGGIISQVLQTQARQEIATFDTPDGSQAANWTATAGRDRATVPNASGAPVITVIGGNAVQVVTAVGAATTGYDSVISIARTLNLNYLDVGLTIPATDDDLIYLRFFVSDPQYLEEVKVYFVCSPFTAGAIPGNSSNNAQAWFKAFRPDDFTDFHERKASSIDASQTFRTAQLLQDFKADSNVENPKGTTVPGRTEVVRTVQPTLPVGRDVWAQFGLLGIPLRRGDFALVGADQAGSRDWSTITGIVIVMQTSEVQPITFVFDEWFIYGGGGPDVTDADAQPYDYRVRHYNIATGAKGNPSPVQAAALWLSPVRQKIQVTPNAALAPPNANLRQQLFRRGGGAATSTDWFYVGMNSSDGGVITDNTSDAGAVTEETLEIDNDQPVTSMDANGNTVLNKIVPVFFMVEDYMFALGDTNQPGRLYRSKRGYPESWPANEYADVCAASEELMNGGALATAGFCFSRTRLYSILLNSDGSWTTEPTACSEGLVGRWAMAMTPFGIAFVSAFGVRLTTGGAPERLSEEWIDPLFKGETVRGLAPIDFTVPTALLLAYFKDELWLTYQDTSAVRRHLIYNFFSKTWRPYLFGEPLACVYGEPVQGASSRLLLGGNATGQVYTHSGFADDGAAITYSFRTGAYDFGEPRREKLLSEIILDAEILTSTLTVQAFLNDELTAVSAQLAIGIAGLRRYTFEPFGTGPQRARNVAVECSASAPTDARPSFNLLGVSRQLQPEITLNQPTPWEELPGGEGYVWGCLITCDTGNTSRSVIVETTTNNGSVTTVATLTVLADGRKKLPFSWGSVLAQQIRIRPTGACVPWIRYKLEWLSDPEPPRLLGWDTNWEDFGTMADKWLKGYLLEADTFNVAKTVVIDYMGDSGAVQFAAQTNSLTFNGRGVQHLTFSKLRGRLFRLRATDVNFGKFYKWQPIFDEEPLSLRLWQTQERPHQGMEGKWQKPLEGWIAIRSSAAVNLRVIAYGASGAALDTSNYTLVSTAGAKQKIRVPLNPAKGLLFEYLLSSTSAFWLYKEESELLVEDFNSGEAKWCPLPASNDDLDSARQMGNASSAARTPGGA